MRQTRASSKETWSRCALMRSVHHWLSGDTLKLDPSTEYDVAVALCRLNRFDECLEYAHRAAENNFPMAMIAADPDLAPVVERLNVASYGE